MIDGPADTALSLDRMVLGDRLLARRLTVTGRLSLFNADVTGSVQMSGSALRNPGGVALGGGGATVRGGVWLGDGFSADGEVRFIGAELRANLTLAGAALHNPGGTAVNLDRAEIGDLDARGAVVDGGALTLNGTRIGDRLNLDDARLTRDDLGVVLSVESARVGGNVMLRRTQADGEIQFNASTVGGSVMLDGARLGHALVFTRNDVSADLTATRLTAYEEIGLSGTKIGRWLRLDGVRLAHAGTALDLRMVQAAELTLLPADPIKGVVSLAHAAFGLIIDDPEHWPTRLALDGLKYQALEPQLPARERLRWLARNPAGSPTQPYEQLAAHYALAGRPADARRILLTRERRQRASAPIASRIWGWVQDVSVGYGFQPWRAVLWLCLLLAAAGLVFGRWPPSPLKPAEAPHFNPVVYCLDLLLPIVDLGQEHAFNPAGVFQWLSYLLVAAGWILATTVATGVARALSRS